ncbi:hypothetical protein NDN08_004546 [Rhodosorus marinus]|uniref:Fungal lipase-type domain-containing protein n=1 Tax=Rhodosorus marinus TaxID=101924 RepID=A0AAV8ULR3_9RHOD|nr:hypothetical protein NDN08_004546 [Rhodosorus marinus]
MNSTLQLTIDSELLDSTGDEIESNAQSVVHSASVPMLKIETLHACELGRVSALFLVSIVFMIVYNTFYFTMSKTLWLQSIVLDGGSTYWYHYPPQWFRIVDFSIESILCLFTGISTVFYALTVFSQSRKNRTREMLFVLVLGVSVTCIMVPLTENTFQSVDNFNFDMLSNHIEVSTILMGCLGATGMIFYIWSTIISFRLPRHQSMPLSYYPKMAVVAVFFMTRILASTVIRVNFDWIPACSLVVALMKLRLQTVTYSENVIFLLGANAVLEFGILCCLIFELVLTYRHLLRLNYLEYRSLQIGFRQFSSYLGVTMLLLTLFGILTATLISTDVLYGISRYTGRHNFRPASGRLAYVAVLPAFTLQQMFYMLPASARSISDLLRCRDEQIQNTTEGQYRYRSLEKRGQPQFKRNSFVLETCVTLFNLGWLAYSYGKKHKKETRRPMDFGCSKYNVSLYAADNLTDTHAVVYAAFDRIVVAFRGTSSTRNVGTDLRTSMGPLEELHAEAGGTTDENTGSNLCGHKGPMVHRGFLDAYLSVQPAVVAEVKRLYQKQPRPIFCTGHSLGGALGTLCSYDLSRTMEPEEGLFCYTFGSPRVGNQQFTNLYNERVPRTWRIINAKDPVTKMPPPLYFRHVGQAALITAQGELFIDPTMFELGWMHASRSILPNFRLATHSNSGYAQSLAAFVERRDELKVRTRCAVWKNELDTFKFGQRSTLFSAIIPTSSRRAPSTSMSSSFLVSSGGAETLSAKLGWPQSSELERRVDIRPSHSTVAFEDKDTDPNKDVP